MPESTLTWHTGSVLPYASLWQAVLRACALNALHASDLPRRRGGHWDGVELLADAGHRIDITAFAHELGEPADAFRWPTLGTLPLRLRQAIASPHPRICLACLSAGYHAALFSINLLDVCPIHGTRLAGCCHCGAPFDASLRRAADYGAAGSCRCGRLHFFTRETCRRPTLPVAAAQALDPVATWLESCSTLARPRLLDEALMEHAPGSLHWLAVATQALGVQWPSCFRAMAPTSLQFQSVQHGTKSACVVSALQKRRRVKSPSPPLTSFWADTPEVMVYRAFARHIRRHVALHSCQIVSDFIKTGDPLQIGQRIRSDMHSLHAFADMLWSRAIEPAVELHRWPDRKPPLDVVGSFRPRIRDGCHLQGAMQAHAYTQWIGLHAAQVTLGAIWREALLRTTLVAHTGIADWSDTDSFATWESCAWLAMEMPPGWSFVNRRIDRVIDAPRRTKNDRRDIYLRSQVKRRATWSAGHAGACLTWAHDTGWSVMDTLPPADLDLRRRRVLGFADEHLWFWLYRTIDRRFVARLAGARLQTVSATPSEAIATLRRCIANYQRVCHVDLPHTPVAPLIAPEPADRRLADDYRATIGALRHADGFWRGALELADAARRYQRARSRGHEHF